MKFKVGDRVRAIADKAVIGKEGKVLLFDDGIYGVEFDSAFPGGYTVHGNGRSGHCFWMNDWELELIETNRTPLTINADNIERLFEPLRNGAFIPWKVFGIDLAENKPKQSITMKITNAFKKFLNPDLQAQVKAGYRDEGLNLTEAGKNAAIEALLDATPTAQAAFTAAANDVVAESEK